MSQQGRAGQHGAAGYLHESDQPHRDLIGGDTAGRWDDFLDDLLAPSQPGPQHISEPSATEQAAGALNKPTGGEDDDETDDDGCEDLLEVTMRRQPEPERGSAMVPPGGSVLDHAEASPPSAGAGVEVSKRLPQSLRPRTIA